MKDPKTLAEAVEAAKSIIEAFVAERDEDAEAERELSDPREEWTFERDWRL